jgi:hypothetical protein
MFGEGPDMARVVKTAAASEVAPATLESIGVIASAPVAGADQRRAASSTLLLGAVVQAWPVANIPR